jgi:transposase
MRANDTRKENQKGQDTIRRRVVHAVLAGMSQVEAAKVLGVSRTSVWTYLRAYRAGGEQALQSRKRGTQKAGALDARQSASIRRSVLGKCPDQLRLPGFLWTREAVGALITRRCGVTVSRWTLGRS